MKKFIATILFTVLIVVANAATYAYYRITNSGGTVTINPVSCPDIIYIYTSGSVTLSNDYTLAISGDLPVGKRVTIYYDVVSCNVNGHAITLFGTELLETMRIAEGYLDFIGGRNHSGLLPLEAKSPAFLVRDADTPPLDGYVLIDGTVSPSAIDGCLTFSNLDSVSEGRILLGGSDDSITTLYAGTNGAILIGNGTTVTSNAVSGDITLSNAGVAGIASGVIVNADVNASAAIALSKLAALTASRAVVTDGSGVITTSAALSSTLGGTGINSSASTGVPYVTSGTWAVGARTESMQILVSFEAAGGVVPSVGDFKVTMPFAGTVTSIYAYAVKAIAGTDNGTIVPKNNAGTTMTSGTVTFTASDARGTAYTTTPSANNTFIAGDVLTFTSAKTTAGGYALLTVTFTRNN